MLCVLGTRISFWEVEVVPLCFGAMESYDIRLRVGVYSQWSHSHGSGTPVVAPRISGADDVVMQQQDFRCCKALQHDDADAPKACRRIFLFKLLGVLIAVAVASASAWHAIQLHGSAPSSLFSTMSLIPSTTMTRCSR